MMSTAAHMPGVFAAGLDSRFLPETGLPELSGGHGVQVASESEQEAVENGNGTNQSPGQVELGLLDLGFKLRLGQIDVFPDKIDVFPDQFEVCLRCNPAGDTSVDGQRDGFGLFLFDACIAQALNLGDCVERCLGHVRSLLILPQDIDHSRPDYQRPRQSVGGNGSGRFSCGSAGKPMFDPVGKLPFLTAAGVA